MPKPSQPLPGRMERFRTMAMALTAVEARYLPNLDPEFIQLSNVPDVADWRTTAPVSIRVQAQAWLSYPPGQISQDADYYGCASWRASARLPFRCSRTSVPGWQPSSDGL
jgi:hypothetical protein